jgi:hypothetical protein
MGNTFSEQLLRKYLDDFEKVQSPNAKNVHDALKAWEEQKESADLIVWWSIQDISWITSLQSYMGWL